MVTAGNFPDTTNNLTPAISLILFSVVVYFAYDLIVTKSILALTKSILGFFIMAALTVALSIFSFGLGAWRSGIIPEAKQIKSVSFYNMVTDSSPESFVKMAAEDVEHTDSGLIDLCITSLKADASFQGDYGSMELKLEDGTVLRRRIRNVGENNELGEAINKNPSYISALTTFPQAEKAEIDGLTGDESSEIFNIYCKEIQEAGNISLFELSYGEPYIHIESTYKGVKTNDYFSVDTRAPKALTKYFEYFENNARIENLLNKQNFFIEVTNGSATTVHHIESILNNGSKELIRDFKEIVGKTVNRTPSLEYKLVIVGVTLDDQSRDNENVAYVLLTNNEQAQIERLQEKLFQLN